MADITRSLADQHIREYDLRLKHLDELLGRVHGKADRNPELVASSAQLAGLKQERDKFAIWLDELKLKPLENWREEQIEKSGPMGVWDAIAQQLEKLVEHIER